MDLELIIRAIWRRKARIIAATLVFGVLVPLVGTVVMPAKYTSTADVSAVPATDIDGSASSTYPTQPDRYVATQIAVIGSRAAAARVAKDVKIPVLELLESVTITQKGTSDVIEISVTTTNSKLSAQIASKLAGNYVADVQATSVAAYQQAIASVDEQVKSLGEQIENLTAQINRLGQSPSDPGSLQNKLNDLISQQASLNVRRETLQVSSESVPTTTTLVSEAAEDDKPDGLSWKMLALYGGAFGGALGVLVVALATNPGRSLDGLQPNDYFEGVRVIGVVEPMSRVFDSVPGLSQARRRTAKLLRVRVEIDTLRHGGPPLAAVNVGGSKRSLAFFELISQSGKTAQTNGASTAGTPGLTSTGKPTGGSSPLRKLSELDDFLAGTNTSDVIIVVDTTSVTASDLTDTIQTLRASGSQVTGLIGVR